MIRMINLRRKTWTRRVARSGVTRNAHSILVGTSEGKRSLGRLKHRWEDNIKMNLREIGCEIVD
jgi:hypothetical protein